MAEEKKESEGGGEAEGGGGAKAPKAPLNKTVLFLAVNALVTLLALGLLVYTKLLFKRPPITEETELKKKIEEAQKADESKEKPTVSFDQVMVNIAMTSGKAHYATVAMVVECRNDEVRRLVEGKKDLFIDGLISTLGKRQVSELNTIQGKLLLKTALIEKYNQLSKPAGITDVFFNQFVLQ